MCFVVICDFCAYMFAAAVSYLVLLCLCGCCRWTKRITRFVLPVVFYDKLTVFLFIPATRNKMQNVIASALEKCNRQPYCFHLYHEFLDNKDTIWDKQNSFFLVRKMSSSAILFYLYHGFVNNKYTLWNKQNSLVSITKHDSAAI